MATQETARPQSGGAGFWLFLIGFFIVVAVGIGWQVSRGEQDRAIFYTQQTAKAATAQPTQPPSPTTSPAPISAPMVVQSVPEGAAPQNVAPVPAQQAAPVGEAAPAPRPLIIVHHQSDDGHQTITGSGACAVGGSVARRCGK